MPVLSDRNAVEQLTRELRIGREPELEALSSNSQGSEYTDGGQRQVDEVRRDWDEHAKGALATVQASFECLIRFT